MGVTSGPRRKPSVRGRGSRWSGNSRSLLRAGHKGIKAARAQYDAWRAIAETAQWQTPDEVKKSHPKASILKGGRVVFNIKANDYRLVSLVDYKGRVVMIRFFGTHQEYDEVDAETV
jgi:mRNA interferase HigB